MKRALRALLSSGLPLLALFLFSTEAKAQCPVIIDSIVTTDVTCSGANDGSICVYYSGGVPNFTINLFNGPLVLSSGPQGSGGFCFYGLGAGVQNYQIIVVGENGSGGSCPAAIAFTTIQDPPPFTIVVSTVAETCPDSNDGEASVVASGGVGPYTYSWPPFATTNDTITGLDGGNYSVIVTDANGCGQSKPFTINTTPDWNGTLTGTDPTCFGGNDGSIASSGITGGTPPYTFAWTGTAQTTENISGLTAGSYTLTATDFTGCTHVFPTVTLIQAPEIVITESHTNVSCAGQQDGAINVSVSGGVGPYTYLWSNGATTEDLSSLVSGNYLLTVTDAGGCTRNVSVTILDGSSLTLSSFLINSECNKSNGSIDLSVSGGSGNYSYNWVPGPATQDISGLSAGVYWVFVTDNTLGCSDSLSFIITDFPAHEATGTVTDGSNCVSSDGAIDVSIIGGSGNFNYSWSHGPITQDVSGLASGTYYITVTDNVSGCTDVASFQVATGNQILVSTTVSKPSCGLINGSINLTVSGGTGPYNYNWSTGATTQNISGIGAGVYALTVTDANGCPFDTTFTISNQGGPTVTSTIVQPNCPGSSNGSISLILSGGVGPFVYTWSNGGSTAAITGLTAATYTVTILDQGTGCSFNGSYVLNSLPSMNVTVNAQHLTCGGTNDGFIEATVSGGTPGYGFVWNPGNLIGQNIYGLAAATYSGTVTDANGCTATGSVTITSAPTLVISETHESITCNGDNDGSIDISVTGGTQPFGYSWQPNGEVTEDLSNLGQGTYEVLVLDAAGCSDSLEVTIIEPATLVLNPTSTDASCNGSCDGTASVSPTGGTLPYTFDWSPSNNSGPSSVSICAGNYSVVVTDANGCSGTANFTIADNQIQYTLTTTDVSCNGSCDGTASAVVTGNNPPFTYDWQPTGGTGPTENGLCPNNYTVKITDGTGCEVTEPFTIIQPDPIVITMDVTDVTCEGGSDGAIDLTVSGGAGPYTYQWYPLGQTTEDINGLPAGDYSVVVTDANGCTSSAITLGGSFNGGTLALPDGTGSSYSTSIPVNGFPSSSTVQSGQDIQGLCVNMEHSYLGDLDIQLTCPNGTVIDLVQSIGVSPAGSTFLGDAADSEANGIPGIGWDYCWSNTPTYGTMGAEATAGNTVTVSDGFALPSGSYTPVQSFNGLIGCPLNGNWTITVTDNFGIDDGFIFDWGIGFSGSGSNDSLATVNEPGPITISSAVTDADCGSCNGGVTVTPLTGNAPYSYLWNTGATTATITNLCAGIYNVEVTDANGCTENFFIPVDHVDGPTGSNTTIVDASCYGACDGEATVSGIGGVAPYTYQWVPGGYTSGNVTGLCAGTYNVQIQDAAHCIRTETVVIGQPAQINIGQTIINSLCGQCTGAINLTPISGVAPYTYTWTQPGLSGTNPTGLCAGVYNVTVTDGSGCSRVITSLINDIPSATLFMSSVNALCNDSCNGQAIATPVGGTPPFAYLWNDPLAQTDSIAEGLCEGLYTITLTDMNGCVAVNQVTLTEPTPIGLSLLIIDNGTCAGNCDGAITVIPSGGTIPFTYLWSDPLNQTTSAATGLCAGTYTVDVTDANGCTDITSGSVNNPVGLTATATTTDVSCNSVCDGSAYVTIVGGTAPFSYLWDDPAGQVTDTAVGLCAGSYTVVVSDVNSCDFTVPVTITEPDPIVITFSGIVNLQCDGVCIGEATANVTGGTGPYSYQWNDALAQNTASADSLCASAYTVTVTDANGCVTTGSITITGPNGLTSSIVSQTNITCNGLCNGSAVVQASGGTAPYTYQWNDINNTANDTVTGLCVGIHSVSITDGNGCISISTVTITQPAILTASTTANDVTCFGDCNATASVFVTGGTPPYSYQWNDPNHQTSATATGLCAGSYIITVTGTNGCVATATETIFQPPTGISIDTVVTEASCGVCNGEIEVIPNGGVTPYTYLWGSGQTTATITGLCPGVHTVDVTDGGGCTRNFDIAVSNTNGPTGASLVVADASCFGVCDGEASVTPTGGTPPYTYNWVPGGQTTSSVTGLCAGNYNVQISDSVGCIYTQLVTIAEPAQILTNTTSTQATCGQCNGQIVLTPSGGDGGPYTYSWSPNVSSNDTASALCAGVYTVTVTDASGCNEIAVFPLSNINGPVVTSSSTDAQCNGSCDGTASISISGGTPPFVILWDDPATTTNSTVTGLCAGIYNATITDANGCLFVAQVTVGEPDVISLSQILTTAASCHGTCDGTATVIPSGGTLPYTYLWSSGGTSATETGLCAGTFSVTVTDANGCTQQGSATISEPTAITFTTTTVDASCFGVCDGQAAAIASGGIGAFTYLWNDPATTANDTVLALCEGPYTVVAIDATGCSDSTTVTINEPDSITITITPTPVSCFGDCNGSAIAIATGGTGPYTYQWNDPSSTLNDTVTGLCPNVYSLVVTDSMGCTANSTTVITEPLPLMLLDSAINITCGGSCDGIAGVFAQGGTGPYGYAWDDVNNSTTPFITGLCAGTYQVIVTDANGCKDSTSVTIIEPPVLEALVSVQNPSCGGVCDGELTVTPTGGTPNYTILWLPGLQSSSTITGLCAGQYTVIVVDASGCSDTTSINLTEPPVLTAAISSVTQVLCSGSCSGEATVTPTGGTPPFNYSWNTSPVQTGSTATGLCVGAWAVTITDDIGCTTTASTAINADNALSATVPISTNVSCHGAGDGTATAFVNGGVGPYTYAWNDVNFQNTQTATGLIPGNYTVTVTDSQSPACVTQASVTITEPATLTLSATATDVTCGTDCDGVGTAIPVGGTPPYVITWNSQGGQGTNLCVGTWTATVTDANGCTALASATVNGPAAIVSNATSVASTCSNIANGSIDLSVVGGVPGYSYSWSPGGAQTQDLSNVLFGTYTVVITDATGCSITGSYSIGTLVNINANAGEDETVCIGTPVLLDGSGGGSYLWTPSATLSDSAVADPIATPVDITTYYLTVMIGNCADVDSVTISTYENPPVDAGNNLLIPTGGSIGLNANGVVTGWTYTWEPADLLDNPNITNPTARPDTTTMFYVTVTDANGCTNTDSVLVEVTPGILFPDGISPNGDGINDYWRIDNIQLFKDAIVEVYNRWGQMLFQSAPGYPIPWDGRFKGKDLPVGTYYYVIHSENFEKPFTGPITIIR